MNNITGLVPADFEREIDGKGIHLYVLRNSAGMEVCLTNLGGIVLSIMTPDRNGEFGNVVIGAGNAEQAAHLAEGWYIGAAIGPVAGRILNGHFRISGKDYEMPLNSAPNTLHSGEHGFHTVVWDAEQTSGSQVRLRHEYRDGEAGFPGNISVSLTFTLTDDNGLRLDWEAVTDAKTIFCPTHHHYFNLNGTGSPTSSIENHVVKLDADFYLPTDRNTNHTGEVLRVEGTPFDFREPHAVGERIHDDNEQLRFGKGYDHVFVLRKPELKEMTHAATVTSPASGRRMDVFTTEIGLVMYSGNYLTGFEGMHSTTYPRRSAICFETQNFPDTPANLHFPSITLTPGEIYRHTTIYKFSCY